MNLNDIKHTIARLTIGALVFLTVKKHKTTVVVVVSDRIPTLVRESLYNNLPSTLHPRRNIESTRNEFSVGLFVLGEKYYPRNLVSWFRFLVASLIRLIYIKPYSHTLILDLNHERSYIFKYWISILKPFLSLVDISSTKIETVKRYSQNTEVISDQEINDIVSGNETILLTYIRKYFPDNNTLVEQDNNITIPRIRFTNLPDGSIVVDACYFYHPIPLNNILEMFPENRILITNPSDIKSIEQKPNSIYIFYGRKSDFDLKIKKFTENYLNTYA